MTPVPPFMNLARMVRGAILVLCLSVSAYSLWCLNTEPPSPLKADPGSLDFGEVWEDQNFHWRLLVSNEGPRQIAVTGFSTSCTCLAIEPKSCVLAPSEKTELMLSLNLSNSSFSSGQRFFKASIHPQIGGAPLLGSDWIVHGRVKRLLTPMPPAVSFGDLVKSRQWSAHDVLITSAVPLDNIKAAGDTSKMIITVDKQDPTHFRLRIAPNPMISSGPLNSETLLIPIAHDARGLPGTRINIGGVVREEVEPSPSNVLLGAMPVGKVMEEMVTLKSLSGRAFEVRSWEVPSNDVRVDALNTSAKKEPRFRVQQTISMPGNQRSEVVFRVEMAGGSLVNVPLTLSYYGLK